MSLALTAIKNKPPLSCRWLRGNGLKRMVPWHSCDDARRIDVLRKEYALEMDATSDILPFAERQDRDDIAGFLVVNGMVLDHVHTFHLTWAGKKDTYWLRRGERPPPLNKTDLPTFANWFATVMMADSIEWMSEEDLEAIKSD